MEIPKSNVSVKYNRNGLIEQEHYGIVVLSNESLLNISPVETDSPFYLRSCAKPLQASLLADYETNKFFNFSEQEIALCCASHAGEKIHTDIAQQILDKTGLNKSYLKCGLHKPLSKTRQEEMLILGENETELHNNCSGKHIMMLAICKQMGWDLDKYYEPDHPLQIAIKNKIKKLCNIEEEYPDTTDGCGVPIMSMPLKNILKGYLNLFSNEKYNIIKNAFLNNPYIIGGEDRTDTKIIQNSQGLIAKVGAGGLCVVINTKTAEGFIVKIYDSNMKAREIAVLEILKRLGWADISSDTLIKTLHGDIVGNIEVYL